MRARALLGVQLGELPSDGHEVARAPQGVAADIFEDVLPLAGVVVADQVGAEEGAERVALQAAGVHEIPRGLAAHVVDEDLAQARRRVDDVDRAAPVLLGHRGRLVEPHERLFADRYEDLELVAHPAQLVGHLDERHLREVPDVRRQLARMARPRRDLRRDVLVEVLVDAVDEDRHRRGDVPDAGNQLVIGLAGGPEQIPALEVEEIDEVVDDAAQVRVHEERVELRIHLQAVDHAEALQDCHRDRDEPDALPVVRRLAVEGDHAGVEDLVADRLVEEPVGGDAGGRAVAVGDALGLEEEGLPEALGGGDDELIAPFLLEEVLDPRGAVEKRRVEVVGDLDVVGVNRPGAHVRLGDPEARGGPREPLLLVQWVMAIKRSALPTSARLT
jgi:hypothetical protein